MAFADALFCDLTNLGSARPEPVLAKDPRATPVFPASSANEEEKLWGFPSKAPELDDGARQRSRTCEKLRRRTAASRLVPARESNGSPRGKRMVSSGNGRSLRPPPAKPASGIQLNGSSPGQV